MDNDEAEKRIKKAAAEGRIEFGSSDEVDQYEEEAETLLNGVLDLDRWWISDMSALSDFSGCGLPESVTFDSEAAQHAAWEEWVRGEIRKRFGFEIESTRITLLEVFRMMRDAEAGAE